MIVESNAKCCHLKQLTCAGTLWQVFFCSEPQTPPPSYRHCIRVQYTVYLFTQGRVDRGRDEPERRLERQHFTKLGRKYQHDSLYLQSINSYKHLTQSPFTSQFFRCVPPNSE
jgi:hypothetical protein